MDLLAAARAGGWLALSAALALSAGRWLSFPPETISEERAGVLWDNTHEIQRANKPVEALRTLEKLLRAYPENPIYIGKEAELFGALGDRRRETQAWELYLKSSPTPGDACPALGLAYEKMGRPDAALDAHRRCSAGEPTNSDFAVYLAMALQRAGRLDEARGAFEKALALAPDYIDAAVGLARLDLDTDRPADARKRLIPLEAKLFKDNPDGLAVLARAEAKLGDKARARALLKRGLEISPNYTDLRTLLERFSK
jgi:tetratricopeptide (TPR) repeat protein